MTTPDRPQGGKVILVGAGPGDPELLTRKGYAALLAADVIFFDELVAPEIVDSLPPEIEKVYVGKPHQSAAISQDEIIVLLIEAARADRKVVRLKGGDPAIFARGGEEVEGLRAAGVAVEIIPGITAAAGSAGAAGIPLTHRDHAQQVTFVTAVRRDGSLADMRGLAGDGRTLVVYMGVAQARAISEALLADLVPGAMPVAIVENATRPDERVFITTVAALPSTVAREGIRSPATFIIGDVVSVRESGHTIAAANENLVKFQWAHFAHG